MVVDIITITSLRELISLLEYGTVYFGGKFIFSTRLRGTVTNES
jgi:hypothetical protein